MVPVSVVVRAPRFVALNTTCGMIDPVSVTLIAFACTLKTRFTRLVNHWRTVTMIDRVRPPRAITIDQIDSAPGSRRSITRVTGGAAGAEREVSGFAVFFAGTFEVTGPAATTERTRSAQIRRT